MALYLTIIGVCAAAIAALNAVFVAPMYELSPWVPVVVTVGEVIAAIAVDGATEGIVRALPERHFCHGSKKLWTISAKEKRFYEKLKIRKWKDLTPELGQFTHFRKNKIADPKSNEYLERYFLECNYGVVGHFVSLFTGFLVLLVFPKLWLTVGVPVAVVNFILNVPSIFILRYNCHKLEVLYQSNLRRQRRRQKADEQTI